MERLKKASFNDLAGAAETGTLLNANGNPDGSGPFLRNTAVTVNYNGNPNLTQVTVTMNYTFRGSTSPNPMQVTTGGFSLLEATVALAIGGAFLTSVLSAWYFSSRSWWEESGRGALRLSVEQAMERIKEDGRLSDANGILFYPQNVNVFSAVSIPSANVTGSIIARGILGETGTQCSLSETYVAQNPAGMVSSGGSRMTVRSYNV